MKNLISAEIKNRKTAIEWLEKVTDTLKDLVFEVYGNMERFYSPDGNYAMNIWKDEKNKNGKMQRWYKNVYYRYANHVGTNETEGPGFYYKDSCNPNDSLFWGTPVEDLKGNDFWRCVKEIKEWLLFLKSDIERKTKSRTNFVKTLILEP